MPERDLEASRKEAKSWEAKYRQADRARIAAKRRAGDAESAATAAADAAAKERQIAEYLVGREVAKYANLEKVAIDSSGVALCKYYLLF